MKLEFHFDVFHNHYYINGEKSRKDDFASRRARDGASVTHVAFHPLHMKMFMATLDGTLYLMS